MFTLMANCFACIRRKKEPSRAITLVIIGLDDAGKTTMVASLQGEPPDGITPTIGFANAEFKISGFKVTVYDLGGGVRIRDVWRNYYAEVFGVVFVVDSCNVERLEEAKDVVQQVAEHAKITGKPFLVFANKQDKSGALNHSEVSEVLDLDKLSSKNGFSYKVVGCSALKGYGRNTDKNINTGFQWLLNSISGEFSKISSRVDRDVEIKKEEDEKERKARQERVRKIREERDRLEREAGNDPDKEESDQEVMMANPFQPIGKHLDDVKAKEKRKKQDKEKKPAKKTTKDAEEELQEVGNVAPVVKKKKKKKKKPVTKTNENMNDCQDLEDAAVSNPDGDVIDIDGEKLARKKKQQKKVRANHYHENELDLNDSQNISELGQALSDAAVSNFAYDSDGNMASVDAKKHTTARKKKKHKKKVIADEHEGHDQNLDDMFGNSGRTGYLEAGRDSRYINEDMNGGGEDVDRPVTKKKQKKKKKRPETLDDDYVDKLDNVDGEVNENALASDTEVVKKPKAKKKKKKKNRTFACNEVAPEDALAAPAWKTSPRTWTSLPPIGVNGDSHTGSLPPLHQGSSPRGLGEALPLQKLSTTPNWTRARPNSEDQDIVT